MDDMLKLDWPKVLDEVAIATNHMLAALTGQLDRGFYWTTWQAEWATDVMFKDAESLAEYYPSFVRYALENLKSPDVMRFLGKKLVPQYQGEITAGGRRVRGLRPWTDPDVQLLEAVARGEFIANGFRNQDLVPLLYPDDPDDPAQQAQRRKVSAKVTRLLRHLRAHRLIEKVEGTHRYLVTDRGRTAIAAILAARNASLSKLQQCAWKVLSRRENPGREELIAAVGRSRAKTS